MPCVVLGEKYTNIDKNTEIYEFLQEINNYYGYEKVVVTQHTDTVGLFKKKEITKYNVYIKINDYEYQCFIVIDYLDEKGIKAYLLGHLHGLGK